MFEKEGVKLVVDNISYDFLKGATVDYVEELIRSAFQVSHLFCVLACLLHVFVLVWRSYTCVANMESLDYGKNISKINSPGSNCSELLMLPNDLSY